MKFYAEKLCFDEKDLENSPALCIAAYKRYFTECCSSQKARSKTFPGIAAAMAWQWSIRL